MSSLLAGSEVYLLSLNRYPKYVRDGALHDEQYDNYIVMSEAMKSQDYIMFQLSVITVRGAGHRKQVPELCLATNHPMHVCDRWDRILVLDLQSVLRWRWELLGR